MAEMIATVIIQLYGQIPCQPHHFPVLIGVDTVDERAASDIFPFHFLAKDEFRNPVLIEVGQLCIVDIFVKPCLHAFNVYEFVRRNIGHRHADTVYLLLQEIVVSTVCVVDRGRCRCRDTARTQCGRTYYPRQ